MSLPDIGDHHGPPPDLQAVDLQPFPLAWIQRVRWLNCLNTETAIRFNFESYMSPLNSIEPGGSRREFLKTSAVAVAGAGLVTAFAPPVHAAGSDMLKVALIGCGSRGTGALVQALGTGESVKLW